MATLGLTRYGIKLTLAVNGTTSTTSKTYNGFNVSTDGGAANEFAQFVRGGGSIAGETDVNPGLVGIVGDEYAFFGLDMTKTNAINGEASA